MHYLIGIDIGTTVIKSILINAEGDILSKSSYEYNIDTPKKDYAEQNPQIWWQLTKKTIKEILTNLKINKKNIKAIGLSGQMHSTVFLDKDKNIIRPAIIWADKRSVKESAKLNNELGKEKLAELICNWVFPGSMCATITWLKKNEKNNYKRIYKIILPKDYIAYKLTNKIATDITSASSTLLFDVRNRKWSNELINIIKIKDIILPNVIDSQTIIGELTKNVAKEIDLPYGIPVITGAGDQETAAIGNGIIKEGLLLSTIGSGGQLFITTDEPKVDKELRIHTFCHSIKDKWHLQAATLSAGLSLRWFAEKIINDRDYDKLSKEAEKINIGSDGLFFLPYLLGERSPIMNPYAKALFHGLNFNHTRSHLIRAIMEGVGYSLKDCLEVFKELNIKIDKVITSGGGSKSTLWQQIQADMYNKEVLIINKEEQACLGACILAGVGSGLYKNIEKACDKIIQFIPAASPLRTNVNFYNKNYKVFKLFQKFASRNI